MRQDVDRVRRDEFVEGARVVRPALVDVANLHSCMLMSLSMSSNCQVPSQCTEPIKHVEGILREQLGHDVHLVRVVVDLETDLYRQALRLWLHGRA